MSETDCRPKNRAKHWFVKFLHGAEVGLYESRWLLFPINAGLVLALLAYVLKFLVDDYHMIMASWHSDTEELRVLLLGLVDTAMVANLLIMIIKGSHQIFIHKFSMKDAEDRPQWLDHIDSGILKIKVALSIAGITLIQLLKDFVGIEHLSWETVEHRMWIHGMCLVSALVMALIWRITHPHGKSNGHSNGNGSGNGHAAAATSESHSQTH